MSSSVSSGLLRGKESRLLLTDDLEVLGSLGFGSVEDMLSIAGALESLRGSVVESPGFGSPTRLLFFRRFVSIPNRFRCFCVQIGAWVSKCKLQYGGRG